MRATRPALAACFVTAALALASVPAVAATQSFTAGWDNFGEPLNLAHSHVIWSVSGTKTLKATFTLVGARPEKLYQVAALFFNQCPTVPANFGQFPEVGDFGCAAYTRQGVTLSTSSTELGVVTTDASGNGSFSIVVGPLASGTYKLEFTVRDAAGCDVAGGVQNCTVDFQAPGPTFGDTLTVTVP